LIEAYRPQDLFRAKAAAVQGIRQMEAERRSNYRAQAAESRPATLVIGDRRAEGYIVDESAGGLCFLAIASFAVEEHAEGELTELHNLPTAVVVAYVEPSSLRTRIGLRRNESATGPRRGRTSFRRAAMATAGVLAGVALGLLWAHGPRLF
jgi:hypothetical protein